MPTPFSLRNAISVATRCGLSRLGTSGRARSDQRALVHTMPLDAQNQIYDVGCMKIRSKSI